MNYSVILYILCRVLEFAQLVSCLALGITVN